MPILELNDFKAWITCSGRKLDQFGVDYDHDNNTVACWIPGIVQSEFMVHWRCMNPENASSGHVWVDGRDVCSGIIRPGYYSPVTRNGAKLKDGRLRPFTFAKLNLTDNDRVANPRDPSLADIGTIEVRISWVTLGPTTTFQGYEAHSKGLVHEKSKKLGAIHTVYGKAVTAAKTRAITTAPLYPENPGPHARFIFRYRTLEMLQAIGIAPRPPRNMGAAGEAAEASEVIDIDDDSEEEAGMQPEPESTRVMRSSPPQGNDGSEEEDEATEAAVGTTLEGKPLFLEDEDETMRSEDEVMGVAGSADMRTGATAVPERQRGGGRSSDEVPTNRRKKGHFFDGSDDE